MDSSCFVFAKRLEHNKVVEENRKTDKEAETDQNWSSGADERESAFRLKTGKTADQSCAGEAAL